MGRYLVVESELKFQTLIQETIRALDTKADIEMFDNFHVLQHRVTHLTEAEKNTFFNFDLILLDFSQVQLKDWKKYFTDIQDLKIVAKAICITAYEQAALTHKFMQQLDVYNYIFKPFDPLILKETLNIAIQPKKQAKTLEIKSQSAVAFIGVLKEIQLQSISELGFVTLSDSQIPHLSISKYFSSIFKIGKKQSVWAQCLSSVSYPNKADVFINKFQFIAIDKSFLNIIRKYVQQHKHNESSNAIWNLKTSSGVNGSLARPIKIALVGLDNQENHHYKNDFELHYQNVKAEFVSFDTTKTQGQIYDHDIVFNLTEISFEALSKFFKSDALFFWTPEAPTKENELKSISSNYKDIFLSPVDKSYLYKKLKVHCPKLEPTEPYTLLNIASLEKIKAANTTKILEINELFLNFNYARQLPFKTFREFIFLKGDEELAIEIPAFCNFSDKSKSPQEGASYFHQFVFYGMTDYYLKEIRMWLLHNHILQNQKD